MVQLWTLHSTRPKVVSEVAMGGDIENYASVLLAELTRRGLVDLSDENHMH